MAKKHQLRNLHSGMIINVTSQKQESDVIKALVKVVEYLTSKFGSDINFIHEKQWYLKDIVGELVHSYPEAEFHYHFDSSSIRPDGGILYLKSHVNDPLTYPILIAEAKNQGTNDLRLQEGLPKQAKGMR